MSERAVEELVALCHDLSRRGLGTSTSGNASVRVGDTVWLTPTGVALAEVSVEGLARASLDGTVEGPAKPTKEAGFHLAVYKRRSDIRAVVHVHAPHAVAVSSLLQPGAHVPSVTPQFVMRAGRVPVLGYYAPGAPELADELSQACDGRAAVLQNHGVVCFADTCGRTMGILEELEENCRVWLLARGEGRVLDDREINELLKRTM